MSDLTLPTSNANNWVKYAVDKISIYMKKQEFKCHNNNMNTRLYVITVLEINRKLCGKCYQQVECSLSMICFIFC